MDSNLICYFGDYENDRIIVRDYRRGDVVPTMIHSRIVVITKVDEQIIERYLVVIDEISSLNYRIKGTKIRQENSKLIDNSTIEKQKQQEIWTIVNWNVGRVVVFVTWKGVVVRITVWDSRRVQNFPNEQNSIMVKVVRSKIEKVYVRDCGVTVDWNFMGKNVTVTVIPVQGNFKHEVNVLVYLPVISIELLGGEGDRCSIIVRWVIRELVNFVMGNVSIKRVGFGVLDLVWITQQPSGLVPIVNQIGRTIIFVTILTIVRIVPINEGDKRKIRVVGDGVGCGVIVNENVGNVRNFIYEVRVLIVIFISKIKPLKSGLFVVKKPIKAVWGIVNVIKKINTDFRFKMVPVVLGTIIVIHQNQRYLVVIEVWPTIDVIKVPIEVKGRISVWVSIVYVDDWQVNNFDLIDNHGLVNFFSQTITIVVAIIKMNVWVIVNFLEISIFVVEIGAKIVMHWPQTVTKIRMAVWNKKIGLTFEIKKSRTRLTTFRH